MARFIDADKLAKHIAGHSYYHGDKILARIYCLAEGQELDTSVKVADVAKVKHGKWEEEYLGYGTYRYRCSECNSTCGEDMINEFHHKNYCSNCGAKMDLEEREKE